MGENFDPTAGAIDGYNEILLVRDWVEDGRMSLAYLPISYMSCNCNPDLVLVRSASLVLAAFHRHAPPPPPPFPSSPMSPTRTHLHLGCSHRRGGGEADGPRHKTYGRRIDRFAS